MIKKGFLLLFFWTFLLKAQEPVVWVTDFKQLSDTEYLLILKHQCNLNAFVFTKTSQRRTLAEFVFEG